MHHNKPQLIHSDQQAIVALCTPRGSGAIALIRISGNNALTVASSLAHLSSLQKLMQVPTHTVQHGFIVDASTQERVDEVLFLVMHAPKTFTGQDTVEITCHNNPFIIERIINLAVQAGARAAKQGEFTKRAFNNGKMDLVQAEALNDMIHAQTELALKQSQAQMGGTLSQALNEIELQLVSLLGYVEASFEFLDEEQRDLDFIAAIMTRTAAISERVAVLKQHFALQKQIKQGVRVALVGSVNAGKSTLFNALVGQERAIVTDIPGTTRDSVEASVYRDGAFWQFIDTAGVRQTDDLVEQRGIERSFAAIQEADIVLLVKDSSLHMTQQQVDVYNDLMQQAGDKALIVFTKTDVALPTPALGSNHPLFFHYNHLITSQFHVSAKNNQGLIELQKAITARVQALFAQAKSPYLLNQRQFNLLTEIQLDLEGIAKTFSDGVHYELLACHVKELLEKVSELTGKNVTEHMLDMVFGEFCVGK